MMLNLGIGRKSSQPQGPTATWSLINTAPAPRVHQPAAQAAQPAAQIPMSRPAATSLPGTIPPELLGQPALQGLQASNAQPAVQGLPASSAQAQQQQP
eukprot:scaffold8125_cov19-Tisochrysis_lutea.AAC.2